MDAQSFGWVTKACRHSLQTRPRCQGNNKLSSSTLDMGPRIAKKNISPKTSDGMSGVAMDGAMRDKWLCSYQRPHKRLCSLFQVLQVTDSRSFGAPLKLIFPLVTAICTIQITFLPFSRLGLSPPLTLELLRRLQ